MITPRKLIDMITLEPVSEDRILTYLETDQRRIDLEPHLTLEKNTIYRIQLWDDQTASLWKLVAEGAKITLRTEH